MGNRISRPGEIVTSYLKKYKGQGIGARTISRKIFEENPGVWNSYDACRRLVSYYLGSMGSVARARITNKEFFVKTKHHNPFEDIPESLPTPETEDYLFPYYTVNNLLIISDLQIKYHDRQAVIMALEYGLKHNVNGIVILGDLNDCFQLSVFNRNPRKLNFVEERQAVFDFFEAVRKEYPYPQIRIFWKLGNHEYRYMKYMHSQHPRFFDDDAELMEEFKFENLFHLDKYNIELIDWMQIIKMGKLLAIHGHEFGRRYYSPVNVARGAFIRGYASMIVADGHQTSEHTAQTADGKIITTWSLGCLCNLKPEYRPINQWNHGFARVELDGNGDFHVENLRIYKGKIL